VPCFSRFFFSSLTVSPPRLALQNTAGFSFLALTQPGYKGPNGEMTWGGVRFRAQVSTADFVQGVRLWNHRVAG
jgi:hypothetical protein